MTKEPTLAQKLGTTSHLSPLLRKAQRLGLGPRELEILAVHPSTMQYDIVEAGQWLLAQGLDESASRAMQIYADKLTTDFPEEALLWALSIPDATRREDALGQVETRLRERHPKDAERLLQIWTDPAPATSQR